MTRDKILKKTYLLAVLISILAGCSNPPQNIIDKEFNAKNALILREETQRMDSWNLGTKDDRVGMLIFRAHNSYFPKDSWPALFQLWLLEYDDVLLSVWWETENPETRQFIVSLFWCLSPPPEDKELWPIFIYDFPRKSASFTQKEAAARNEECAWVRNHIKELQSWIIVVAGSNKSPRIERLKISAKAALNSSGN
jgi:hypothetical protein